MARSRKKKKKRRHGGRAGARQQQPATPPAGGPRRRWLSALALLIGLAVALGGAEIILRLTGFSYQLRINVIKATAPNPEQILDHFRIDPDLIWVPGNYAEILYRARRIRPEIVFMGDSCTHLGRYHAYLASAIGERLGRGPVPYANLGVAGWTSVQGLAQLQRDVPALRPRIVTLYFGWNDHWLSIGVEDREASRIAKMPLFRFQQSRLIQLLLKSYVATRMETEPRPLRVPLASFHNALTELVAAARQIGAVPVLLTAPTSHERGLEPDYLRGRWIDELDGLVPLHQSYLEAVREVARLSQTPLCDLAAAFAAEPGWKRRQDYFLPDGIHLQDEGDRLMASFLLDCFERQGLVRLLEQS